MDATIESRVGCRASSARSDACAPNKQTPPIPIRPDQRFIFLSESGTPLTRAGLDNAWQDLILAAIEAQVIAPEDRFTLHGLKHRGITDIVGRRAEKKAPSGHSRTRC